LGAAAGAGLAAAAAGAIGFALAAGVTGLAMGTCGDGAAGLAPPPGGGDGEVATGLFDAGSDDGFGTCGDGVPGLALCPPGDCVPGVIAAEGVVGFALGGCGGGVAGLTLFAGPGDGVTGATAAEGVDGDCFAAGVCDGGVLRSSRPADDGVDVPGAIAAEGGAEVGVCGVTGLGPPPGADDGVPGTAAAEGDVGVAGVDAGACEGAGPGLVLRGAEDGVLGAIGVEGVAAVGICGVPGLAPPPGAGNGVPGVIAAEEDVGVAGVNAGACEGAGPGFVLPGADGAIAADGVLSVVGVPGADGRGCPFIPGNGWPS
jgi:hypothetical protein